jgi:dipeptidyl aminopeptidase/acylaminoacyl peptidase
MNRPSTFALALAVLLGVTITASAEPVSILMQEGIFKEESLGDLEAAIQVYQQIIANGRANGQQAPQAHYRLGMCYLKQGKRQEAAAAFERLLKDYPNQQPYGSQARSRLVELGIGGNSAGASGLILRKVWPEVSEDGGGISPDGRYISFTDWTTGELYSGELTTGQRRCLTKEGLVRGSDSVFSPDGKRVAYTRYFQDTRPIEVCVVGLDGSEPRVLVCPAELAWLDPAAWSPEGKSIVGVGRRKDKVHQIVLISVADGSIRTLKSFVWPRFPGRCWFSPDGRHIVYHIQQVENPADDQVLGWAPDGKHILFVSDRTGTKDAWLIQVADGKPVDIPKLIKPEIGDLDPWGFTSDGAFYYATWGPTDIDIYLAKLDSTTEKVLHPAVRADLRSGLVPRR